MSAVQFSGLSALLRVSAITIMGCALAAASRPSAARPSPAQGAAVESPAPPTAVTQAAARSAAFWRASVLDDVEAAYRMLREDHPGAAPEVGDGQFQKTLEEAHRLAAGGALQVDSFAAYAATLARFANAFGDKHVRSRPVLEVARPDWAGLIVSRRGTHWIVADAEQGSSVGTLLDAQLISCDGRTPDDWGAQILGHYRVDWSVDAQRIQAAPWLLISDGNPFVPRPSSCVFAKTGLADRRVELDWRHVSRSILSARMDKVSPFGAAGFGVRKTGSGYWIAVQELTENAVPVVAAVKARAAELREAPFVVLDLRGNGGGSSMFGDEIAAAILGDSYVKAVVGDSLPECGGEVIRVSADNVRQLQMYHDVLGPKRGPEFTKTYADLLNRAKAAQASGRGFTGPLSCPRKAKPPRPVPSYRGTLFLVTDGVCFSSCLDVVSNWRDLGAIQLGQTTDADTHYTEVRDDPMPSGLSTFSTMMGVDLNSPAREGPFVPSELYEGDIRDTPALEAWVLRIAAQRADNPQDRVR
jgi:Peptidase family S41